MTLALRFSQSLVPFFLLFLPSFLPSLACRLLQSLKKTLFSHCSSVSTLVGLQTNRQQRGKLFFAPTEIALDDDDQDVSLSWLVL